MNKIHKTATKPDTSIGTTLPPVRAKLTGGVLEREILRVVATIRAHPVHDLLPIAREQILRWARNRSTGQLPTEAWEGAPFETLAAGRTTIATRVTSGDSVLWSLRGDDPDKSVAGRIWSTEISLGRASAVDDIRLGVRLIVNSTEPELVIEPAVPGLVRQIVDKCGLWDGSVPIQSGPHYASEEGHINALIEWLLSDTRRLPLIVATGDERASDPNQPKLDADKLAIALCGLAHVVWVPADLTFRLTDTLGKSLTVFHGGVRIYQPCFSLLDDSRDHRLILGHTVAKEPEAIAAEFRRSIARESLRRTKLGHDVLSFAAVRSASTRALIEAQQSDDAGETEQLATTLKQIETLEQQIEDLQGQVDQAWQLSEDESARAEASERQLSSSWAKIETLEAALATAGSAPVISSVPENWDEFAEWCDTSFSGKLSLAPAARRGIRKALFQDISIAIDCINWLTTEARNRFIKGGGTLANISVIDGITNAPCGKDEYAFDFQGRRLSANWHLKNGGNTRQPERCLRIYYAFDEQTQQIIISDMPAHIKTGAS